MYIHRCWTLLALLFYTKKSVIKNVTTLAACPPGCGDPRLLTPSRACVKAPVAEAREPSRGCPAARPWRCAAASDPAGPRL